jgi:hypothetical protein
VDLAYLIKVDEKGKFAVGPHAGPVFIAPNWDGKADIGIENSTGFLGGITFYAGGEKVKFSASVDYLHATFDVTGKNGWQPNEDHLNISGFALQIGTLFRF